MRSSLGLLTHGSLAVLLSALMLACTGTPMDGPDVQSDPDVRTDMDAMAGDDAIEPADTATEIAKAGDDGFWHDPNTLPDGAVNPCLPATTCSACTDLTPCAWCNGRCMAGTATGSFDGTCSGDQWLWRGVQCPGVAPQCPTHTDCMSCAEDPDSCGWCANTHQCVTGDRSGPAVTVAGCSPTAMTWVYNFDTSTCP